MHKGVEQAAGDGEKDGGEKESGARYSVAEEPLSGLDGCDGIVLWMLDDWVRLNG